MHGRHYLFLDLEEYNLKIERSLNIQELGNLNIRKQRLKKKLPT